MEKQQHHAPPNDEEWISKYRAALNSTSTPLSRAEKFRTAVGNAYSSVMANFEKVVDGYVRRKAARSKILVQVKTGERLQSAAARPPESEKGSAKRAS